jgi:hypothetical protein
MVAHSQGSDQQPLYREVNRRIREVCDSWDGDDAIDFLCECGHPECTATFGLTVAQFDGFAGDGTRLVASEHRNELRGERLIAEYAGFVVVGTP